MSRILNQISGQLDRYHRSFGHAIAYLSLGIVLIQFLVVLLRYIFSVGSIFLQESILYQHAILLMLGSAYTLLVDGHVRLDIYYREFNARIRSIINIIGVICFLFPTCIVIWVYSLPYIQQSWRVLESSKETSGLPFVYLLKTVILLFTILLLTQGLSLLIRSILDLGSPPNKEPSSGIN